MLHSTSRPTRAVALVLAGISLMSAPALAQTDAPPPNPDFGPNVTIFDSNTDPATLQKQMDDAYAHQESNQFGSERYAFLFKPGTYKVDGKVGFYTQVYGLGKSPDDTTIQGGMTTDAKWMGGNGTCNFWRGLENMLIAPDGKIVTEEKWAVSQAAPFRRMHIKGTLSLFDGGWTSGGYMADCKVDGNVVPGSQQQWFTRNSTWSEWDGGVWNMVFAGVQGAPGGSWPDKPFTTIDSVPIIAEKPFLFVDDNGTFNVFVPLIKKDSSGADWDGSTPDGVTIPLSQFYIAHADKDTAATINAALAKGQHLLLTPGIYNIDDPIKVTQANTVVLGIGMPTISPRKGKNAMEISDVSGVHLANVLFDAGPTDSPVLLQVGDPGSTASHADNPTIIYDIFCRIGGAGVGVADRGVIINSNDVIGDQAWIWRADHGEGAGWYSNKSLNGLVVNGANVTYYGLFVEHFQEDQVLWNGENGRTYFFQSEMPYDPPTQDVWKHGDVRGWPAYKVADNVTTHEAWGMGIYCVFNSDNIYADTAVECPKDQPGVKFHHVLTFRLAGHTDNSGIQSVINGVGAPATKKASEQKVLEYPSDSDTAAVPSGA